MWQRLVRQGGGGVTAHEWEPGYRFDPADVDPMAHEVYTTCRQSSLGEGTADDPRNIAQAFLASGPHGRWQLMSTASRGRATEHLIRDHLIGQGWRFIMRAAASKGSGDLLMSHPIHGAALIQCGRGSKALGPAARCRLCDDAESIGALALLAIHVPRHGIALWAVDRGLPGQWERWVS
jgi:hypothetical protein